MKRPKIRKIPATPKQVAMYGHIAVALREWMARENLTVAEINTRLGVQSSNTGIYNFLNGKGAPGASMRTRLHKVTGIPEADLLPRRGVPGGIKATPAVVHIKAKDVLSFAVDDTGMAVITLHARLPLDVAMPLLRMILDAGVVFNKGE